MQKNNYMLSAYIIKIIYVFTVSSHLVPAAGFVYYIFTKKYSEKVLTKDITLIKFADIYAYCIYIMYNLLLLHIRILSILLNKAEYSLVILENGWVKKVLRYISMDDISVYLPAKYFKPGKILKDINDSGICRIRIWEGLFRITEFHITGIWDY